MTTGQKQCIVCPAGYELGKNQEHEIWKDNVARYTKQEMEAAVINVNRQLLRPYTLAFYYTTEEEARTICRKGGSICASDHGKFGSGVLVSVTGPDKLGWQPNAGGDFRRIVNETLEKPSGSPIDTMLMLGVPTVAVQDIVDEYHAYASQYAACSWTRIARSSKMSAGFTGIRYYSSTGRYVLDLASKMGARCHAATTRILSRAHLR
eukprot:COSAG01_NODE_1805_length_9192_cov_13.807324_8_plen_207_part_00